MYQKETPLVTETINFTIDSLASQNRYLNGAHSISDIKLPCDDQYFVSETNHLEVSKVSSYEVLKSMIAEYNIGRIA